jgi:hypothetical protein
MTQKQLLFAGAGVVGLLVVGLLVWLLWPKSTTTNIGANGTFGAAGDRATPAIPTTDANGNPITENTTSSGSKISDGPVTGASFVQTSNPTTTLARFVMQQNGHVVDLPLDVPGAIVRSVSNTTIPGTQRMLWGAGGTSGIMQYLDHSTIKTLYITFPPAVTNNSNAAPSSHIQFLPDNIQDIALSPDLHHIAYLLRARSGGSLGYTANIDGSSATSLFTIPLTQLLISWPATTTVLLQTKSMAGTAGVVFGVSTKNGAILPLIYGQGVTATANNNFSAVVYQSRIVDQGSGSVTTYLHNMASGADSVLSLNPYPEKCVWNTQSTMFCASPLQYTSADFLDSWHMGTAKAADSIFFYKTNSGISSVVAIPGSSDGGVAADIAEVAVSPDNKYLLYTTRGDRSLWGVRL